LITGATGGVGIYLVQLAKLAGVHITALSSSSDSNRDFLLGLGADEVIGGLEGGAQAKFDIIIDMVGGETLESCWHQVIAGGTIISLDSASYDFVEKHQAISAKEAVKAIWFIVEPSRANLETLSKAINLGLLKVFVGGSFPLKEAALAYDQCSQRQKKRGKTVLMI
jgi:NADPH2:quinone reductase